MRKVIFSKEAFDQFLELQMQEPDAFKKLIRLIDVTRKDAFGGIGKPEPLKHDYKGKWSRRITDKHRLIYEVTDGSIHILECKSHYGD